MSHKKYIYMYLFIYGAFAFQFLLHHSVSINSLPEACKNLFLLLFSLSI